MGFVNYLNLNGNSYQSTIQQSDYSQKFSSSYFRYGWTLVLHEAEEMFRHSPFV